MCHHYTSAGKLPDSIVDAFGIRPNLNLLDELIGGYYPLSTVPVIWSSGEQFKFTGMEWGLLPLWWKPTEKVKTRKSIQRKTFNARCETVHEKPAYPSKWSLAK